MAQTDFSRWIAAGTLLVAGACTPISETSFTARPGGDVAQAKVFAAGYEVLKERYLNPVSVADLALESMRGLRAIDSGLSVERKGDRVVLSEATTVVGEYPAPAAEDVDGWANLTAKVAADSRGASESIGKAATERLTEVMFEATLAKLDLFSRYSNPVEAREHRAQRNGFGGVGIRLKTAGGVASIVEVFPDAPAAQAHLKVGDRIVAIDGQAVAGLTDAAISIRLRGAVGASVAMVVQRDHTPEPWTVAMNRVLVVPPTVSLSVQDGGVAVFKVSSFNERTAVGLAAKLREAKATMGANFKGVVLDLRGNPGGLLDQAVAMADLFMAHGRIVSTRGRNPLANQSYDARPGDIGEDVPMVVMVDGRSASSAEIVTAALQDSGRAVVVGTNSYGKGTVQTVVALPNGAEMTVTWSRFHSPSGYALHGLGVLPTVCTSGSDKASADALVAAVREGQTPVTANLALWRTAGLNEGDLRKQLRANCPSQKHADSALDLDIAKNLMADHRLYDRALRISAPVSTAHAANLSQ